MGGVGVIADLYRYPTPDGMRLRPAIDPAKASTVRLYLCDGYLCVMGDLVLDRRC